MCLVDPHRPTCVSLQGAIFLFFAGRIEAIKGNVDTVSNGGLGQCWRLLGVSQTSKQTDTDTDTLETGQTGRSAPRENQQDSRVGEAILNETV